MPRVPHQAAVIPYRIRKERVEVALVTTSGGSGVDRAEGVGRGRRMPARRRFAKPRKKRACSESSLASRSAAIATSTKKVPAGWMST